MNYTGKIFLFVATATLLFSACGQSTESKMSKDSEANEEPDSIKHERLRAERIAEQDAEEAQIEATLEKLYLSTDTILFGDLSIVINGVGSRNFEISEIGKQLNAMKGEESPRFATIRMTITNNGKETLELPYAHFAKKRGKKIGQEESKIDQEESKIGVISIAPTREKPPISYIASRLVHDEKSEKWLLNMTLKPGQKKQVIYTSIMNKTQQWLLQFSNFQQVLDIDTPEGQQWQRRVDKTGIEVSMITDDYEGTRAYVDLNDVL